MAGPVGKVTQTAWLKVDGQIYQLTKPIEVSLAKAEDWELDLYYGSQDYTQGNENASVDKDVAYPEDADVSGTNCKDCHLASTTTQ